MIKNINPFDAGEEDVVRRHPIIARLFARVAAIENGEVIIRNEKRGRAVEGENPSRRSEEDE